MAGNKDTELVEKVVAKIKKIREQRGISQSQFLSDTGIHIARIESEHRDISITTLSRICNYFGVTMQDFLKGIG
ncbi:helix-turn-helix domain-containing protein [Chryseolinea lacunae]|uniref:Helix-turn-helix transcriptional regulator n=1 Tax=Chryseolinea lacunae TaxID=2801331 RepID=A0ABS1KKK1_9BACT|nr:helix-turn-helix transcriptional regulator [Chryseolinea lacunae]